ncbi:MAG TPA: InlB B-repeat-containing protein [Steroidobacteraceae bacterium]|jgi:pectate lyase|nr:InlB B-repeat-containing protein [Steroidobacteraceae bacterium]
MISDKNFSRGSTLAFLGLAVLSVLSACGSDDKSSMPAAEQQLSSVSGLAGIASSTSVAVANGVAIAPESGTWFESAFATWAGTAGGYRAFVRTRGAYDWRNDSAIQGWLVDWEEADAELVRKVDPARNTWRVDIPGLPRGEYEIQIRAADGVAVQHTFTGLQTASYPRNGAAFVPSNQAISDFPGTNNFAPNGAVGGYLPDGRVDPSAIIVYATRENMATTLPSNLFSTGRGATANARTPLVVRILGTIGSFETVAANKAGSGSIVPPGVNDSRMLSIGSGNGNVTVEGIGPDAIIFGWGITTAGAHNVEFRNLRLDQWYDDAIYIDGGGTGTRSSNTWVHNNTFGYGQNKHLALGMDPDQAKGDGAVDISNQPRNYTVDYNVFAGSSKAMLIGGGTTAISNHYGTVHHNWFHGSEERTPRVRNGRIHVFNNLYQDIQGHPYHNQLLARNTGYGIGAGHNATIWAEGNVFDHVNFPFLRSRQGHARGHQVINYEPGPNESATANAGYNHFFGDAPGFIVSREVVTDGDFPANVAAFRRTTDYLPGLTDVGLQALREAALTLEPNVLDDSSRTYFDPDLDIGIVVAAGSTTTNPAMSTSPAAQFDWSFRPNREGVWPTGTPAQVAALRVEIDTRAGATSALAPTSLPAVPAVSSVTINDEVRSAINAQFIPAPGKVVVYANTFTINWVNSDVSTTSYEIQWNGGAGEWETIEVVAANARPTRFITQEMNQFATPETVHLLATAASRNAMYAFRIRAVNSFGASDWSANYVLNGHTVTFNASGGSAVAPVLVAVGSAVAEPESPTKESSLFGGWSVDAECEASYDFDAPVTADVTLYACWDPAPAQITLATSATSVTVGTSATLTWTSSPNTNSCVASGAWSGNKSPSGSESFTPSEAGEQTYKLTCRAEGGDDVESVAITAYAAQAGGGGGSMDWWSVAGLGLLLAARRLFLTTSRHTRTVP